MTFNLTDPGLLKTCCYVDGNWLDRTSNSPLLPIINPATGEMLSEVAIIDAKGVEKAILAAQVAMPLWAQVSAKERSQVLRRWFNLIMDNQEDLAILMTKEQGKPLAESRGEIAYGASFVEWFSEQAKRIDGDVIPGPSLDKRVVCIKQPIGVVAAITPWNFPNAMIARKVAPALAAGCSIVVKPASETPLSALALAELADRAGVPAGVLNVVVGAAREIGPVLTRSPIVRKLTFTGSTEIGRQLEADCASTLKRTSMELGGNAPFIVFDDANINAAIEGAMISKYRNSGQTCVCANRFLIQDKIHDEFVDKLAFAVEQLKLGDGLEEGVQQGPLINEKAAVNVKQMVKSSVLDGAKLILGGERSDLGPCFFQPTILTEVAPNMTVFRNEIFGPVAPITRFRSEAECIELANDTEFGLASYLYTRDIGRVWRVSEALEYGMVGINEGIISNEMAPFGGVKASGSGREGSKYGIEDYVEIKYMLMGGLST